MDQLKKQVTELIAVKDEIKRLTERKKVLEKAICETMNHEDVDKLELPNGSTLTYQIKDVLTLKKEKEGTSAKTKTKGKAKAKSDAEDSD